MSFAWPEFSKPLPLEGARSWTAKFDSYDQRNEDCYCVVTIQDKGREAARFMVRIGLYWVGED